MQLVLAISTVGTNHEYEHWELLTSAESLDILDLKLTMQNQLESSNKKEESKETGMAGSKTNEWLIKKLDCLA